jgi:hypothetical protein
LIFFFKKIYVLVFFFLNSFDMSELNGGVIAILESIYKLISYNLFNLILFFLFGQVKNVQKKHSKHGVFNKK